MNLTNFLKVCDTIKYNGVTEEALRLRLFPLSLGDRAKHWLTSQPPDSITTWNDLVQKFLTKFFPPSKIAQLVQEINTFGQLEGENLAEAWDRFHELLRKCLHHRLTRWMQVHTFYNGLRNATRTMIDASTGGSLMKKTTDQAYENLEDAATNTNQWLREKATPVTTVGGTDNEVLNNLVNHVAQLTKQLNRQQGTANAIQTNPWELCEFCGGQHSSTECQSGNPTVDKPSTCRGLIRINHSIKDRMGITATRIRIRDKGGVTIRTRIIKTTKGMDGGTIRTIRNRTELVKHTLRRSWI